MTAAIGWTSHIDGEDDLSYETARVVVPKGFIVAYRRLVSYLRSVEAQREDARTRIHVAVVVRKTAALYVPYIDNNVSSESITPPRSDTPVACEQGKITLNPDRREGALGDDVQFPSFIILPGWNSKGTNVKETRRRLSQGS